MFSGLAAGGLPVGGRTPRWLSTLRTPWRQMPSASSDTVPAPAISVPTVVSPVRTDVAVEVRGSPRLSMTTVERGVEGQDRVDVRLRWAASGAGSMIALGRMLSDEPPE